MPSKWAEHGFPDAKFGSFEKLNAALTRAWKERNYWANFFYNVYDRNLELDGVIGDRIPEYKELEIETMEDSLYQGMRRVLAHDIGPYNVYGSYPNGYPEGIIAATNQYYAGTPYTGIRHYFVGSLDSLLYPDSVISRVPIGRGNALIREHRQYLEAFVEDYKEQFFPDFCYSLGEDSRHYLKFIPLHTLYRKMYEYVNTHCFVRFPLTSKTAEWAAGSGIRLRQKTLDFLGDTKAYWLFGEPSDEQFLCYRTEAGASWVNPDHFCDYPLERVYLDLSPVLQFYDPPG